MSQFDFAFSQRSVDTDNAIVIDDTPANWFLTSIHCSCVGAEGRLIVTIAGEQVTTLHVIPGAPISIVYGNGAGNQGISRGLPALRGSTTVIKIILEDDNPPAGYTFDLNAVGTVSSFADKSAVEGAVSYVSGAGGESGGRVG